MFIYVQRYVYTCQSVFYMHLLMYSIKVLLHVVYHHEVQTKYHKRRKIRWGKLSQIPPNEVFYRNTFTVPYV